MEVLFGGVRAPSMLGSHLRSYTWGNVSQLEKAAREFLVNLAARAPLLPGADVLAFAGIDAMQKRGVVDRAGSRAENCSQRGSSSHDGITGTGTPVITKRGNPIITAPVPAPAYRPRSHHLAARTLSLVHVITTRTQPTRRETKLGLGLGPGRGAARGANGGLGMVDWDAAVVIVALQNEESAAAYVAIRFHSKTLSHGEGKIEANVRN